MKNSKKFIVLIFAVWILILFYQNVQAQRNLAQEAYAIFEQSCLICHGENGAYRESLIIEHTALIEGGTVIPGNPEDSVFYQRLIETDIAKRMPLGQPPLAPAAIETIRQWIAAGAPDWDAIPNPKPDFITTDVMLETIENHVNSLSARDKSFARYFTLTHLYNAGETTEALNAYRRALSKLINSLSWGRKVVKPQPIDAEQTLFYIDLRDYEWDVRNDAWTQIEQAYPYKMTFDAPTQTHLREKMTILQQEMNCEVPFINVDWFLATASLPPLYHDILALPETDRELEASLEVFVVENLLNAPGKRVWRAGFNNSRVSRHNRVVERHISRYGAYWKSYDFAGSAESQNIFTHPLDFTHDGGEIIFNLPNGLQAYYLADGDGNRLNEAPIGIVSNPAVGDPTVRNGLSCIGCHTKGMQMFEDEVRAVVEQIENPPFNKERALDLYVEKTEMDGLIAEDTQRYRDALEAAGGVFGGIEPVQRLHEAFQAPLSAAHAAAAIGLETDVFLEKISKSTTLQNLLGTLVVEGGTVKRDAWTLDFHDVISGINSPDTVPPPVVERPEIIPGAGVHIPDANLRAAIEKALGKDAGEVITVEDMAALNGIKAVDKDIRDLTGIEHAINASWFTFEKNQISDLSPLAGLKSLHELRLGSNHISTLSPLSGLINLTYLSLYNNPEIKELSPLTSLKNLQYISLVNSTKISDISSLAELVNLKHIKIWGSPISDLSPLASLTYLEILDICGADKPNISVLKELTGLKEVYLVSNGISDLQPLAELTGLTRLNLDDNNISDVSPLANLTNLKWLNLTNNPITDFSPLAELAQNTNIIAGSVNIPDRNLRAAIAKTLGKGDTAVVPITLQEMATLTTLRANNKDIKDLTGIEYAINLENFFVSMTEAEAIESTLSDLSPLAGLTKLRRLSIPGKMISDLSPLSGLVNLAELQLFVTNVSNLSPLAGLTNLKSLLFNHAPVSDLSPIAELTGLESLRFFYAESPSREGLNPSLEPLKGLVGLKILSAARSRITDISPLSGLVNLEELELFGNQLISDVSPLASMHKLRRLNLHRNDVSDVSSLASLRSLVWVDLAFNNISDISPMEGLPEDPNVIWYENPGFPVGGPKIEGPWLWSMVPGPELDNDTDFLAQASGGAVTEIQIASYGAVEGTAVGESVWTAHNISLTGGNNISEMTNALGWTTGEETVGYILYGSVKLNSPREQQTEIFVGADDGVKVWLNGEFIHKEFGGGWDPFASNYQSNIPVTLNKGVNVLLVAIDNIWGNWSGFFGFEPETEYTVLPIGIAIPDLNLRAAVADALGKGDSAVVSITVEEMMTLRELNANKKEIRDLTGLEHAINLEGLEVRDNQISDLLPLQELIKLYRLNLKRNAISDLSPISGLLNLTEINLEGNLVSDLSPLKDLKKLGSLKLWDCPVSDLSPLAELTELVELNLADQRWYDLGLMDLSPLSGLTNMKYLVLHNLKLSSGLEPLAGLINLKQLKFDTNNVTDISPLANLINLESITTWGNPISNFSPLANLTKLKTVDICGADIKDLSFLDGKTELTELYLVSNGISDVTPLAELTGLTRLNLEGNKISDVSPLKGLTNLKWLKLINNPITDYSPLAELSQSTIILTGEIAIPDPTLRAAIAAALGKDPDNAFVSITVEEMATIKEFSVKEKNVLNLTGIEFATNLRRLDLLFESLDDKGFLSDLSPLAGLTKLKWLRISGKSITDLSPLAGLTNLENLELVVTDVSNLSPLAGLSNLKSLWFNHAPVSDISPLASITSLENLQFYYTETPSLEPLKGLSRLKKFAAARSKISDISPLAELVNLEEVDLFDGSISDILPLTSLHKLRRLNIIHNEVSDVSPLASLHNLEWLHLAHNKISDISPLESLPKNPKIIWYENPGFPVGGPKIEGPWLWVRVPGSRLDDSTDFLAQAGGGNVTELQIATDGAVESESVGESTWTSHKVSASVGNNIGEMMEALGWTIGEEKSGYILYGSIKLNSPQEQQTNLFVGASDSVRVWLNGQLVHKKFGREWWEPHTINYQHVIPVTLNKGVNVLLVAIDNKQPEWLGFFGFEPGTEYTVPSIGYTISETDIRVNDTFTFHLNAENVVDLAGWQFDIAFDPNILEAIGVSEGDFLKSEASVTFFQGGTIDNTEGKIKGMFAARQSEGGVSGTGTLLSVTFMTKSGGETQITLENFEFGASDGTIIPTVPPNFTITVGEYPAWDVNQDGRGSILDLILVAQDFGSGAPANLRTDVNRDGVINVQDLIIVSQHIGESTEAAAPTTLVVDREELTPAIVQTWIDQAQAANDGSLAFRQGIENLQKLLTSLLPEKTALLANYPNPFNPETWIPYHLAKSADVTLTIYAANGAVVRTLALGHQAAGIYQSRSRAAHWDGKNSVGESVASGIYFYTLSAGDFTATRRMLILK